MWRVIAAEPSLGTLKEFQDGTYSIDDLADMHEALNAREEVLRAVTERNK